MDVDQLRAAFQSAYPDSSPPRFCRAPGRVNLIGEHMDYNGLPVLPMAIAQEIRIAFAPRTDGEIRLRSPEDQFSEVIFQNGPDIPPSPQGAWENYCKAAVQGLNRHLGVDSHPGMNLLVSGDLPMAKGLSSSSALVVGCGLAYLAVLGKTLGADISRLQLADLMATAEHYVGTRGGGMDQTVILNAEPGHACKIDFFPLRVEQAPVPADCAVVVCDSMVKVEKSGAALARFNLGPALCHLASALVQRHVQETIDEGVKLERLGDLWFGPLCLTYREAEAICRESIPEPRMPLAAVAERLGMDEAAVRARWLGDLPLPDEGIPLQARLRHQFTEFRRVETARDALQAGDAAAFGELMNASHTSCAEDFGISSAELDALVDAARASGALGARLTGAGFGGATVNLVPLGAVDAFIAGVTERYYRPRTGDAPAPIFVARACAGAGYLDPS